MYSLEGKRALVLCGTRGIGLGVAHCLASHGCAVTVSGTDGIRAAKVARSLPGGGNSSFVCDFRNPADVGDKVANTGPYDVILLNSPGFAPGTVDQLSSAQLQQAMELMLFSIQRAVEASLPEMKRQRWGRFISITSTSLSIPISNLAASTIARSALQSYLKLLAENVAQFGITVNHVIPGKIDTDRLRSVEIANAKKLDVGVDSIRASTLEAIPLGRYGTPEDVGQLVSFLASEKASYITGTGIRCDGGFTKSI
jgi:3-oxoacyl-[acyl-carrier protein] reductase